MKLHLPLPLRASLLAASCLFAAGAADAATAAAGMGTNWGNTLYVGDSITHGFNYDSYRWSLFKTLVDNGITQSEVGIQTGYVYNSSAKNIVYGGSTFANLHAAQTGITARQVAGQGTGKLDGSGIVQWLGQDEAYNNQANRYIVHSPTDTTTLAAPDTAFVMLGTNDIFNSVITESNVASVTSTLLGYLDTITQAIHTANKTAHKTEESNARIIINAMPTWSENRTGNMGNKTNFAALTTYNESLKAWAEENGATFIDINKGLINVANTAEPGAGVATLFKDNSHSGETQHPNKQGDLIIAGNIARQLGYAGRTAGQQRVGIYDEIDGAAVFSRHAANIIAADAAKTGVSLEKSGALLLENGAALSASWSDTDNLEKGFTVDFSFADGPGNGATEGWNTTANFSLSVGDGTHAGTLNVNEAYIQWGSSILYSMDTSTLTESLRVAYVYGDTKQGLSSGFYVWMGDMLIGEALSGTGTTNGLSLANGSGNGLTLTHLSMATGAWAPTTTLYTNGNPLITPAAPLPIVEVSMGMPSNDSSSGNTPIRNSARDADGYAITEGAVHITVTGGPIKTRFLVGNQGAYTGDISITLKGETASTRVNDYNPLQYNGDLTGCISLQVDKSFTTTTPWGAFIGADKGVVSGDIRMEFASSSLSVGKADGTCAGIAVAGTKGKNIGGSISLLMRDGTYNGAIYGGDMNTSSTGGVIIGGSTEVTLEGGTFKGNVYAGGQGGTIKNGATLTVGGAAVMESTVTTLSAGSIGNGLVENGTTLTVKDVQEDSAFANYSGTLDGGNSTNVQGTRNLRFDNVQLSTVRATLQNFDAMTLTGKSDVSLSTLGGATYVTVGDGSHLTLTGGEHTARVQNSGLVTVKQGATLNWDGTNMDGNVSGHVDISGGNVNISKYDHLSATIAISSGSLANLDGTNLDGGVTVNAAGDVALSGVALENITSLTTQEGAKVSLTLDNAVLNLNSTHQSTGNAALMLGENGSLSTDSLTLNLDSELSNSSLANSTGQLLVNQGTLTTGLVIINLAAGSDGGYRLISSGISCNGGYSYVNYTKYAATTMDNTDTFGNGNKTAIANLAANENSIASGNIAVSTDGGTVQLVNGKSFIVAHEGAWEGSVAVELGGALQAVSNSYNVAQYTGTLNGSITQVVAEGFKVVDANGNKAATGAFVGASCTEVTKDVAMVFSSGELEVTGNRNGFSVKGTENTPVGGNVSVAINKGSFSGGVTGAYASRVGGDVTISVSGGSVGGNVSAAMLNNANTAGSNTVEGDTDVTISGGTVNGNVYGGNGHSAAGVIKGNSSVTVAGDARITGNIYAGSNGGTIGGNTTLTIKDVASGDSMASYSGSLDGGTASRVLGTRTLCFDSVQGGNSFNPTLSNFTNVELTNASSLTLADLGGAGSLTMDEGSCLTITGDDLKLDTAFLTLGRESQSPAATSLNFTGNGALSIGTQLTLNLSKELCSYLTSPTAVPVTMALGDDASPTATGTRELVLGTGNITAANLHINAAEGYSVSYGELMNNGSYSYVNVTVAAVPEPTTATLSLLALAGLAARRRRK